MQPARPALEMPPSYGRPPWHVKGGRKFSSTACPGPKPPCSPMRPLAPLAADTFGSPSPARPRLVSHTESWLRSSSLQPDRGQSLAGPRSQRELRKGAAFADTARIKQYCPHPPPLPHPQIPGPPVPQTGRKWQERSAGPRSFWILLSSARVPEVPGASVPGVSSRQPGRKWQERSAGPRFLLILLSSARVPEVPGASVPGVSSRQPPGPTGSQNQNAVPGTGSSGPGASPRVPEFFLYQGLASRLCSPSLPTTLAAEQNRRATLQGTSVV